MINQKVGVFNHQNGKECNGTDTIRIKGGGDAEENLRRERLEKVLMKELRGHFTESSSQSKKVETNDGVHQTF